MNKLLRSLILTAPLLLAQTAGAVAVNKALLLGPDATVHCGAMARLSGATDYTLQFWMCPDSWTQGATLFTLGNGGTVSLGADNTLVFDLGGQQTTLRHSDIAVGQWAQITLIREGSTVKTFVNGTRRSNSGALGTLPEMTAEFVIGGGYSGRIDEVRLWNAALRADFNYFVNNTINRWTPQRANLVAYYKFDQRNCPGAAVEYSSLWPGFDQPYTNHGRLEGNVSKVDASDNTRMPYLINGAYTANERFFDRIVKEDQYLLSNDLIILGIQSYPDGHLRNVNPDNHGTLQGSAALLDSFEGRSGVLSLDGQGWMSAPAGTLNPAVASTGVTNSGYTLETWLYIEQWVEGAYIFCKENADHSQGLSVRLGSADTHQIIVRCNGKDYVQQKRGANDPELLPGKWMHLGITPGLGSAGRNAFAFTVDGKTGGANASLSSSEVDYTPKGVDDIQPVIGQGFVGKIDEFAVWDVTLGLSDIVAHGNEMPLPAIGKSRNTELLMLGNAFYKFDNPERPGFSSLSQENWKLIMQQAYAGHDGYEIRISVKSHNGWESTIANSAKRKIFAQDLARLSEPYDGVELDLEWMYGTQTYLGLLAKDIREVLPEGKSLMISCHNVAYGFPKDKMQYVDGFTFQQYGPQREHSYFSHFKSMCQAFQGYGFENHKIIGSYATTTSMGYTGDTRKVDIIGVKDGLMEEGFVPQEEVDKGEHNGYTFYFDGPLQTYLRAKYITDNNLGGIFYWDMGNDTPVEHPHNLAKHASYGLNSNVEPAVTSVDFNHWAGVEDVLLDNSAADTLTLSCTDGQLLTAAIGTQAAVRLQVFNLSGAVVARAEGSAVKLDRLAAGIYVVRATDAAGRTASAKYKHQH